MNENEKERTQEQNTIRWKQHTFVIWMDNLTNEKKKGHRNRTESERNNTPLSYGQPDE